MPIYVYQCPVCGNTRDVFAQSRGLIDAPLCAERGRHGAGAPTSVVMQRVPSAPSVQFKGGGWAKDGYSKGAK